jgi:hypothetical protein
VVQSNFNDCPIDGATQFERRKFFMSFATNSIKRGALVGVILVSTSLGANALTIARCNVLEEGAYRPALLVESNGEAVVHRIGEDGLTRSTVFDEQAALAWAAERYGTSFKWNAQSSCNPSDLGIMVADNDSADDVATYLNP